MPSYYENGEYPPYHPETTLALRICPCILYLPGNRRSQKLMKSSRYSRSPIDGGHGETQSPSPQSSEKALPISHPRNTPLLASGTRKQGSIVRMTTNVVDAQASVQVPILFHRSDQRCETSKFNVAAYCNEGRNFL